MLVDIFNNRYTVLPWINSFVWDIGNNRLYAIHYRARDAVHAYELSSGQHLATYAPNNPDERIFTNSVFLSADHSHIVYHTAYTDSVHIDSSLDTQFNGCASGIAVYDVASATGQIIYTAQSISCKGQI